MDEQSSRERGNKAPRERDTGNGPKHFSRRMTKEALQEHFYLPMEELGQKWNISTTMIKRVCRRLGIKRWPYRQIKSLKTRMDALRDRLRSYHTALEGPQNVEAANVLAELRRLEGEANEITGNANVCPKTFKALARSPRKAPALRPRKKDFDDRASGSLGTRVVHERAHTNLAPSASTRKPSIEKPPSVSALFPVRRRKSTAIAEATARGPNNISSGPSSARASFERQRVSSHFVPERATAPLIAGPRISNQAGDFPPFKRIKAGDGSVRVRKLPLTPCASTSTSPTAGSGTTRGLSTIGRGYPHLTVSTAHTEAGTSQGKSVFTARSSTPPATVSKASSAGLITWPLVNRASWSPGTSGGHTMPCMRSREAFCADSPGYRPDAPQIAGFRSDNVGKCRTFQAGGSIEDLGSEKSRTGAPDYGTGIQRSTNGAHWASTVTPTTISCGTFPAAGSWAEEAASLSPSAKFETSFLRGAGRRSPKHADSAAVRHGSACYAYSLVEADIGAPAPVSTYPWPVPASNDRTHGGCKQRTKTEDCCTGDNGVLSGATTSADEATDACPPSLALLQLEAGSFSDLSEDETSANAASEHARFRPGTISSEGAGTVPGSADLVSRWRHADSRTGSRGYPANDCAISPASTGCSTWQEQFGDVRDSASQPAGMTNTALELSSILDVQDEQSPGGGSCGSWHAHCSEAGLPIEDPLDAFCL